MNARSLALVGAAAIFAAAMLTVPAADAATSTIGAGQPVVAASDALADARSGVRRLEAYEPLVRTMPKVGKAHDYRASLAPAFWSVVALWSPGDGDMDLELFADKGHTTSMGRSAFGTGLTDFIAVDRRLVTDGEVFPQAKAYSGTSTYDVEFAQGLDTLGSSSKDFYMQNSNIVRVYDSYLSAGVTYTFVLDPTGPYQDGDLFLVGSTPGDPATGVQRRYDALRTSADPTWGTTETFTFTPSVSDTYGVVVINDSGSGSYTLTRTH